MLQGRLGRLLSSTPATAAARHAAAAAGYRRGYASRQWAPEPPRTGAGEPLAAQATLAQRVLARTRVRVREHGAAASEDQVVHVTATPLDGGSSEPQPGSPAGPDPRALLSAPEDGLDEWDNLMMPVPRDLRGVLEVGALRPSEMRKIRRSAALVYEDLMGEGAGDREEAFTEAQELLLQSPDPKDFFAAQKRTARNYNRLIRIQGAHGRLDLARTSFDEMLLSGLQPDLFTLTAMFSACVFHGSAALEKLATPLFEQMDRDVGTVFSVVEAAGEPASQCADIVVCVLLGSLSSSLV